jgi:predicted permease
MWTSLETLGQDLRYALRQLRKSPSFAAVAILTLALGIGANTAVFSVMDAVLLRDLPVAQPGQLVYLHTSDFPGGQTGYGDTSMRMQVYEALRRENKVFSDLMAWVPLSTSETVPASYGSEPEEIKADMVSGNFFSGLGVPAVRGRTFTPADELAHAQIAVLSYGYWSRRFARNPSVLGETLFIKGVPFTIVGIAGQTFVGLDEKTSTDVWVPFQVSDSVKPWGVSPTNSSRLYGSEWWFLLTIGRLHPGITQQQALAYLQPIFQRAAFEGLTAADITNRDKPPALSFTGARGMEGMQDTYEQPLRILMGMVALVLVIAGGNIAMLLVARNASRQREFSLRMALGGNRMRMFRQLLTESALLVVGGASLGWAFALWATQALARWSMLDRSLAPDWRVLWFTLAVCALVAILFGLAPLRNALRVSNGPALMASSSASFQDRRSLRVGRVVIPLQMAMCLVLLVGAGLLVQSLRNLETLNLGLNTSGLLVFNLTPQQQVHNDAENVQFYQSLLDRLRALPGVESATVMRERLGAGWSSNTTAYVDGQKPKVSGWPSMRWNAVGPDVFHVLGVPLAQGRDINDRDTATAPKVVVINQTFAQRYLPGTIALGHTVALSSKADAPHYTIVGVAADSKYTEVRETERPMAYFPYTQVQSDISMAVGLRTAGNPEAFLPVVRRAMQEFAPGLALLQPRTQEQEFSNSLSQDRLFARLAMFFGLLAVVMIATGLYGMLAYKVARRTAEIGVRMALGAQQHHVLWMIIRESLLFYLVGVLLGVPGAIAVGKLLKATLFGLQPQDPFTFGAALAGIALIAFAASLVPARRASSVDPMVALRFQ